MRSIKKMAAIMLLAVTASIGAQTSVSAKGIILLDRNGNAVTTEAQPSSTDNDNATGIMLTNLTKAIGIILLDLV